MNQAARIILIGPMGAGKTTIGRQLAKTLGMDFMDSDHEIEKRTGVNIPLIFDLEGEEGFRQREIAIIDDLSQYDRLVLATGGGVVLKAENRQHLHDRGIVIYLHAEIDQLLKRTHHDRNRPLLQTDDPRKKFEELMSLREPLYRETAHITIDTDHHSINHTVSRIISALEDFER